MSNSTSNPKKPSQNRRIPESNIGDMPIEDFRKHLHEVSDWVVDYFNTLENQSVLPTVEPEEILSNLSANPPTKGKEIDVILEEFKSVVLPGIAHWNHPSFHAYFNSTSNGAAILAQLLTVALNANAMLWKTSPAATELEEISTGWLRQFLGLPDIFWGIIYEGGSTSNLHGLAAARENACDSQLRKMGMRNQPPLALYTSEQAHSSIEKALITLGLGTRSLRKIPLDSQFRMNVDALTKAIKKDRKKGWQPFCVVANIGSTSTTSVDPISDIADICKREDIWLHIDAAHGGALALLEEKQHLFKGWERADSIIVNPHKWLFVPIGCSVLFTQNPAILSRAFSLVPEYLRTSENQDVTNYMNYGITLGRPFRSLKLYFTLQYFGREGLIRRLRTHLQIAECFKDWVDIDPNFERMAPVPMSTVCFRAHPEGIDDQEALNKLNEHLMDNINRTGNAYLSHTEVNGAITLRMAISGLRTQKHHVKRTWSLIKKELKSLL